MRGVLTKGSQQKESLRENRLRLFAVSKADMLLFFGSVKEKY